MLLVVGQLYKGKLFSYLTKISEPVWPENVKELVDSSSQYMLITLDSATFSGKRVSIVKTQMKDFRTVSKYLTASAHTVLEPSLNYFEEQWHKLALEIYQKNANLVENFPNLNISFVIPPSNIVVIDNCETIDMLSIVVPSLTPNNVISKPILFTGYDIITPWYVRRTYFFPIFIKKLSLFFECGIHDKIREHVISVNKRMWLQNYNQIVTANFSTIATLSQSQLYFLAVHGFYHVNSKSTSFSPLTIETLKAVFILSALMLAIGLIAFVVEHFNRSCCYDTIYF